MQRRNPAQPGYDYQQVRRQEDGDDPSRAEMVRQPRFEQTSPGPVAGESSSAAVRRGKQRAVDGPRDETHPALRGDPDLISLA